MIRLGEPKKIESVKNVLFIASEVCAKFGNDCLKNE